jgi:uncharacterized protein YbjT (DUF2867 family)
MATAMGTNGSPGDMVGGLVLVTGGNGKTGKRVAERLIASGRQVRIGSRSGNPAFDWNNQAGWAAALDGVEAVYVAYQPDLAVPTALETVTVFFDEAVNRGVKKIVLLSGRGEPEAEAAEAALRERNVDWTILRSSWFQQNFSESFFLDALLSGVVALPVGSVAEPFVDVEDIAEIGADAFADSRHSRQLYELTGPQALSFADAVKEISRATGLPIGFIAVSPEAYREELVRLQVPQDYIDLVLYLLTTVLDGRNTPVCDGVQRALGRPPRSFANYVRTTAATGIWRN